MWLYLLRGSYWRIAYCREGRYQWEPISPAYMHIGHRNQICTLRRYGSTLYSEHLPQKVVSLLCSGLTSQLSHGAKSNMRDRISIIDDGFLDRTLMHLFRPNDRRPVAVFRFNHLYVSVVIDGSEIGYYDAVAHEQIPQVVANNLSNRRYSQLRSCPYYFGLRFTTRCW